MRFRKYMLTVQDYNTQLFAQIMLIVIPGWDR